MSEGMQTAATAGGYYSQMKNHLPVLSKSIAIVILVINCIFPGIGTMLLSCIGGQFKKEHLIVGLLQMVLAICVIGWIWSILWGVILIMKSNN